MDCQYHDMFMQRDGSGLQLSFPGTPCTPNSAWGDAGLDIDSVGTYCSSDLSEAGTNDQHPSGSSLEHQSPLHQAHERSVQGHCGGLNSTMQMWHHQAQTVDFEHPDRFPRANPYVGDFRHSVEMVAQGTPQPQPEMNRDHPQLTQHNPCVGTLHRGVQSHTFKRRAEPHAAANQVQKSDKSDDFVHQFLPLGMMSAALTKSGLRRKGSASKQSCKGAK